MAKKTEIVKKRISLYIDNDVIEAAKGEAEKEDRSLSVYIQRLLKKHLKL
jgi:hypothetical protein